MKTGISSLLALSAISLLSLAGTSSASTLASDNASNATYSGGQYGGLNGGTGFLAWSVTGSNNSNADAFYGSYVGATGQGTTSFALYSGDVNTGAFANAVRPFDGAFAAAQTFSADLGNTTVGTNGLVGLSLQDSGGTTQFNLQSNGATWSLVTGSTTINLGTDTAGTSYHFTLTYNGGSGYSYTFTGATPGDNLTTTATINGIIQANFFDYQQGSNQNFGFNNLAIVPEPNTWAIVLLGVGGLAVVLRRRLAMN